MPGDGWLDGVIRVISGEGHVPDGEVEARPPRLDGHDPEEPDREELPIKRVSQPECLPHGVVLKAAGRGK